MVMAARKKPGSLQARRDGIAETHRPRCLAVKSFYRRSENGGSDAYSSTTSIFLTVALSKLFRLFWLSVVLIGSMKFYSIQEK